MTGFSGNWVDVCARIRAAALAAGRDPESVRLIAVSKTVSAERVREAYAAGQRAFGENYAQELDAKAAALSDLADIEWHMIGHLQTNKAKIAARIAHWVHTVDSVSLVKELAKRVRSEARAPLSVLIEVNMGGEPQKHGVAKEGALAVQEAVLAEPALMLRGLMTVAPEGSREGARRVFDKMAALRAHLGERLLPELSMGMSGNLEEAVAAGATLVRVGTALFGERRSPLPS